MGQLDRRERQAVSGKGAEYHSDDFSEGSERSEGVNKAEKVTRSFVNTIKQITPNYQRKILLFLARNSEKKFTNIQIAQALSEDRSNIWRFINNLIEESGEHSLINKIIEGNDVYYSWKEPSLRIEGLKVSEILRTLSEIEENAKKEKKQ